MWWGGTEHQHDTCPRRYLLNNAWIGAVLELYYVTGSGKFGAHGMEMPHICADAMAIIDDARAFVIEQERQQQRTQG